MLETFKLLLATVTLMAFTISCSKTTMTPEAVDLGLSVKWRSYNLGATKSEQYGGYYTWGKLKEVTDTILDPDNDVAHVTLGGKWRMPTDAECKELISNCTSEWTTMNGVNGRMFTSKKNGKSIFFPAAGFQYYNSDYIEDAGSYGGYWSSSVFTGPPEYASILIFDSDSVRASGDFRLQKQSVRPVSE